MALRNKKNYQFRTIQLLEILKQNEVSNIKGKSSAVCTEIQICNTQPNAITYMFSEPYNLRHHLILHEEQTRVLQDFQLKLYFTELNSHLKRFTLQVTIFIFVVHLQSKQWSITTARFNFTAVRS